ncbi:MAG: hypothetical protein RL092_363 [Bacteroidota bacterium]
MSTSMNQLAEELLSKLKQLQTGQLNASDTDELVNLCGNLYEKLIVLRYKAYVETDVTEQPSPSFTQPIVIDTAPVEEVVISSEPNQVNLIDAIAEAEQTEEPVTFQLIAEEEVITDISEITSPETISQPEAQPVHETQPVQVIQPTQEENKLDRVSVNDSFKPSTVSSLAQKLEGSAIADLKKNISLNQRFQFCKDLFKGNNQEYEVMVEKLNNTNRDEALRILDVLTNKYSWNPESNAVKDFTDLVNRRYL